ncbi:MAG: DUF4347 domain-containing protein, partial [Betaproteobacteria bacterium]
MLVEAIEPRILHSADISPLQLTDEASEGVAEMRYLDGDGEFIHETSAQQQEHARELIFVDTSTPDYQDLLDHIISGSDDQNQYEIVLIDPESDGVNTITNTLVSRNDLSAVHIVSHGSDGNVELGSTNLTNELLAQRAGEVTGWANAFSERGDILIYGCNLAASEVGQGLVDDLALLTRADVAASDDLTGHTSLGGDWDLEYHAGEIETDAIVRSDQEPDWSAVLAAPVANDSTVSIDEHSANAMLVTTVDATGETEGNYSEVYWVDKFDGAIYKANADGTGGTTTVLTGISNPVGLAVDNNGGKIYWTTNESGSASRIQSANLDGSNVTDLVTGLVDPDNIALDLINNKMYWTDDGDGQIRRANLDGSGVESLVAGLTSAQGIALDVDGGKMYWTDYGTNKIQRANLDGSGIEDLVTGLTDPDDVELDLINSKMYWVDFGAATVQRANLDGSSVENLVTSGLSAPYYLALDVPGGKMYWSDDGSNMIQRANLDGTNIEDLVTSGTNDPRDLVLGAPGTLAGPLSYSITAGNTGNAFNIDTSTGQITVADSNVLDFDTTPTFVLTVHVQDTVTLLADTATVTINLNDVNIAPVLTGANNLATINEDPVSNPGTLVSDLISGQITDTDAGALEGIAVIAVDDTNGSWEYTTDGGSNWTAFVAVDSSSARLLATDANTYVRFVPNASWSGTVTNGLTFHAWDQSSGSNGGTANLSTGSSTGGTTAFSTASASSSITVTPVTAVDDAYSVDEDGTLVVDYLSGVPTADLAHYWDLDGTAPSQTATDSGGAATGTLGSTGGVDGQDPVWTASGQVGSGALSFDGVDDYVQTTSNTLQTASSFTISVWFQTDTTTGQHHMLWQGVSSGNGWGIPGGTNANSEMHLSVGTHDQDNVITFFWGYDDANANSIEIVSSSFTDTSGWHHAAVVVTDLGGGSVSAELIVDGVSEGTDTGSQTDRSTWDTDLRLGRPGTVSRYFEGNLDEVRIYDRALSSSELSSLHRGGVLLNDSHTGGDTLTVNTTPVSGPSNGTLTLQADGTFTYTPDPDFHGTDSFVYEVSDSGGNTSQATATITVNPLDDAPVGVPAISGTTTEDQILTADTSGISDDDGL